MPARPRPRSQVTSVRWPGDDLLAVHGVVGLALFATGSRLARRSFLIAALPAVATLVWLACADR